MEGKVVTIINRSEIVGRPLGALLANDGESLLLSEVQSWTLVPPFESRQAPD